MNVEHLRLCASAEWAETVEREILPWALGDRQLGVDSMESPDWWALHVGDTCVPVDPTGFKRRLEDAGFVDVEVELSAPPPARRFRFLGRVSPRA